MAVYYESRSIQFYADPLYKSSNRIILITALSYAFISFVLTGLAIPSIAALTASFISPSDARVWLIVLTIAGFAVGVDVGRRKALVLLMQVQQALCLEQVASNTNDNGKAKPASAATP